MILRNGQGFQFNLDCVCVHWAMNFNSTTHIERMNRVRCVSMSRIHLMKKNFFVYVVVSMALIKIPFQYYILQKKPFFRKKEKQMNKRILYETFRKKLNAT